MAEMRLRPCYVMRGYAGIPKGLFHCWTTIDENGTKAAIVELEHGGVALASPNDITFIDDIFKEYSWGEEEE